MWQFSFLFFKNQFELFWKQDETRIDVFLLFLFLLFLRPYFKLYANGTRDNVMRTVLKHCETRGRVFEYSDRLHPGTTTAREFIYHVLSRYLLPREITL